MPYTISSSLLLLFKTMLEIQRLLKAQLAAHLFEYIVDAAGAGNRFHDALFVVIINQRSG
jgi:hypothetical protein